MPRRVRRWVTLTALAPALLSLGGCATLESLAQLRDNVRFHLDRTSDASLAGIDLDRARDYEDLRAGDLLAVAGAVRRGELPLRFDLHVGVENTSPSGYDLHLERLEWTLLLEDRETVSGVSDGAVRIAPDGVTDIPIAIELDLLQFFREDAADLARLAVRAVGGGRPVALKLRARPTLRTPFGPLPFPNAITILSREL